MSTSSFDKSRGGKLENEYDTDRLRRGIPLTLKLLNSSRKKKVKCDEFGKQGTGDKFTKACPD